MCVIYSLSFFSCVLYWEKEKEKEKESITVKEFRNAKCRGRRLLVIGASISEARSFGQGAPATDLGLIMNLEPSGFVSSYRIIGR